MPKDKVEIINQRKTTKTSNVSTIQKTQSQVSSRTQNEEVKKTRELSIDRNNLRKTTKAIENKIKIKKTEPTNSTKPKTTSTTTKTNLNKTISKTSVNSTDDKKLTSSRTSLSKTTTKPVKALKTPSNSSSRSNSTSVPSKGTKTSSRDSSRDVTSKRVTKEQYFPKKYPFSSYLHEDESKNNIKKASTNDNKHKTEEKIKKETKKTVDSKSKLIRERTLTRILSPSEVELVKHIIESKSADTSISDERPRTATIRKHETQVNQEIKSEDEISNEYEDDFESYESDFEVYSSSDVSSSPSPDTLSIETDDNTSESSSTEELIELSQKRTNSAGTDDERKMDSGNYDLHDVKHKQILDNIKEATEKENTSFNLNINNKNDAINSLTSLSDEGFEDGSKYLLNNNNGFVNFMNAKKQQQNKKNSMKIRKRGDDLMNMIRLNSVSFTLFDMDAISYEEFMQSYGRRGTMQISSQTGDDDISEEVQTEEIKMVDKTTQFPIRFSINEDDKEYLKNDNKTDLLLDNLITKKLNKFIETTGKLILNILEQNETKTQLQIKQNQFEIPFSDGYLEINYEKTQFLCNRNVIFMTFSKNLQLLTVHESNIQVYMNENEQLLNRSTICLWDIYELSYPQYFLVSSGDIIKACFDSNHGFLIFGAIEDGSISVWDIREDSKLHRTVYDEQTDTTCVMRSATYTAIPTYELEPCNEKIIAIQSYHTNLIQNETAFNYNQNVSGIQVCTLTESGIIVIWTVIQKESTPELLSDNPGLVLWGSIILVQGIVISLQKLNTNLHELQCYDLQLHYSDTNHLFIATNYGVLHCLSSGMKPKPKLYLTEKSPTICIEMAPFSPTYFLSSCENGNIQLHSRFYEKPLMTLRILDEANKNESKIEIIEWSRMRPCIFFVKDDKNNIHVWDLMSSDMFPIYTIPFNNKITDIKLSPVENKKIDEPSYMAIACKDYGIRLHKLSKEFCTLSVDKYKKELDTFLNYANRL